MKYRVYFKDGKYYQKKKKTKGEAVESQARLGGEIQRRIGCVWCKKKKKIKMGA